MLIRLVFFSFVFLYALLGNVDTGYSSNGAQVKKIEYFRDTKQKLSCDVLKCPDTIDGYHTRIRKYNISSGQIQCSVIDNFTLDKLADYNYINEDCRSEFSKAVIQSYDNEIAKTDFSSVTNLSSKIEQLKKYYQDYYSQDKNKIFLKAPNYLIAGLTADSNVIDIPQSVLENRVILKDEFTATVYEPTANAKNSGVWNNLTRLVSNLFASPDKQQGQTQKYYVDKDTQNLSLVDRLLSNSVVYIFNFYSNVNEYLSDLLMILTFIFIVYNIAMSTKKNNVDMGRNIILSLGLMVSSLHNFSVKSDDNKVLISQNLIQIATRELYYAMNSFADDISMGLTTSYLSFLLKEIGIEGSRDLKALIKTKATVSNSLIYLDKTKKLCDNSFDTKALQTFNLGYGINYLYPPTETINGTRINFDKFLHQQYVLSDNVPSIDFCYSIDKLFLETNSHLASLDTKIKKIKSNIKNVDEISFEDYSEVSSSNEDYRKEKQIKFIVAMLYKSHYEFGFISIGLLPLSHFMLKNSAYFDEDENSLDNLFDKIDEKYQKDNQNFLDDIKETTLGGVGYAFMPMFSQLYSFINDVILPDVDSRTTSKIFSFFDFGSKVTTSVIEGGSAVIAYLLAIFFYNIVLENIVYIIIVSCSLLVVLYYVIRVFLFYLIAPFLIVFAFSASIENKIADFLRKIVLLSFTPFFLVVIMGVIVIIYEVGQRISYALVAINFNLLKNINAYANPTFSFITDLPIIIIEKILELSITVILAIFVGYILLKGSSIIVNMSGFRLDDELAETVGGAVERVSLRTVDGM